jgi:hypothetical protein
VAIETSRSCPKHETTARINEEFGATHADKQPAIKPSVLAKSDLLPVPFQFCSATIRAQGKHTSFGVERQSARVSHSVIALAARMGRSTRSSPLLALARGWTIQRRECRFASCASPSG